jgi:hypothetical protein
MPVVAATSQDFRAGSVLIKADACLRESASFESKQYGRWKLLTEANGFSVERTLSETGWHFFFMVPEIRLGDFAADPNKAMRSALKTVFRRGRSAKLQSSRNRRDH